MKKTILFALAISFLILISSFTQAQTTGKIAGTIKDAKTGETLIGATVLVEGTTTGAATNVDGKYILNNVSAGHHSVIVSYIGYEKKLVSDVDVKAGSVTPLDVVLIAVTNQTLKEVTVRATFKQESVAALYAAQKANVQVTDGITADLIRRSPDRNTGEILKRVSGTSIQDGKFVVIRGLSDRYNSNLMNNAVLPSSEPDRKAFAFDIIPSSLVDNVVIYKTATPDLPGDFAGGSVKINTKDLPDSKVMEITANIGYNSKTTFQNNRVSTEPHGGLDFLGYDDGSRAIPSAYESKRNGYTSRTDAEKIDIATKFPNTFGYRSGLTNMPNVGLQLTMGNSKVTKKDNRIGYIFSVNYRKSQQFFDGNRTEYNASNTGSSNQLINYSFDRQTSGNTTALGGLFNLAYSYGKSKLVWRNLYNNDFNINFEETLNGKIFEASPTTLYKGFSIETTQNGLYSSVLEGTHSFGKRNIQLNWNASYGLSYRNQPDQRVVTIFTPENGAPYINPPSGNSPLPNLLGRIYSSLHENILGGTANLTYPFKVGEVSQTFKAGAQYNYRNRDFVADALGYVNEAAAGGNSRIELTNGVNIGNVFSPASIQQNHLALERLDLNSIQYTGTSNLTAGYAMFTNNFNDRAHLTWGARFERYDQQLAARGKATRNYINNDVLPSGNFTYNLTPKTNLRLSYFKSVNRPEFRELAEFGFYDYNTNFRYIGEPNLKRASIDNADFRFEFYPSGGEIISVSAFYKKFKDPIEQVNAGNDVLSWQNALSSTDYGMEVELRKKLDFIGGNVFKNFTFYVNASYIDASVSLASRPSLNTPLQGQSPYLINSGLYYLTPKGDLSFNVLYNRIGQRLAFRGQGEAIDIYEKPRDVIDFQVSKNILHNNAEIKLTISDLLHQTNAYYYNYGALDKTAYNPKEDKIIQNRYLGTSAVLSFKYKFGSVK